MPADELFPDVPPEEWRKRHQVTDDGNIVVPVNVAVVQIGDEIILIDAGLGGMPVPGGGGGALFAALAALGATPEQVTRVILTHLHGDHVGGLFARAHHHIPRADWQALETHNATEYIDRLLVLPNLTVDEPGNRPHPMLRRVDSPGHTPGHRCVVVESRGDTFGYLGDLFHDAPLHVAQPERVTAWDAIPSLTPDSRRAVAAEAAAGNWLLACAHTAGIGRIIPRDGGWTWSPES